MKPALCSLSLAFVLSQTLIAGILPGNDDREIINTQATVAQKIPLFKTISYGNDPKERFDVYTPLHVKTQNAPVIFMVHGGAWKMGDKKMPHVVENKVNYWVNKGYIVISTNYKLLPDASVAEQVNGIAKAIGVAQEKSASFGGSKEKFILMGHSAGAHLIALLSASSALYPTYGITPPLGSILLDSAVMDTPSLMQTKHMRLYDEAFGNDPRYWEQLSPYHQLSTKRMPLLAVCSTKRDNACPKAEKFLTKASSLGTKTVLLKQNMTHQEINELLGKEPTYTQNVDQFINQLLINEP